MRVAATDVQDATFDSETNNYIKMRRYGLNEPGMRLAGRPASCAKPARI